MIQRSKDPSDRPGTLPPAEIHRLVDTVQVATGAVVSRTLMTSAGGTVTAFAFDAGQSLSEHSAPFDALVQLLDGELVVTISGDDFSLSPGDAIVMPANVPHAVRAPAASRWTLVMLKSPKE